jgi:hypothetical protein
MNFPSWQPQDLVMLERLYTADQKWPWDDIISGNGAAKSVAAWLARCPAPRRHPLVLPVWRNDEEAPRWLCMAFSEMQCEELREHLNAFIGTAGCDFEGRRSSLPESDKIASIAREWTGGNRIFYFESLPAYRKGVRERLERMLRVWTLRPETDSGSLRTTEAMLREFHLALVNLDERSALAWWEELRVGGRLNGENLLFLKMEIPAAFARWDDIDLDPNLPLLAGCRRPRRTTAILIEAMWHTTLKRKIAEEDVTGAIASMRERIQGPLRGLFRSPAGLTRPPLLLTFLIAAAADLPPRHAVIEELLNRLPVGSPERDFAGRIAAARSLSPVPTPATDVLALARAARDRDDFLGAWILLKPLENSAARCRLLLECAAEHWEEDTAATVTESVMSLAEGDRASIFSSKQRLQTWDKISAATGKTCPVPADWESWLHEIEGNPSWSEAVSFAQDAPARWPVELYLSSPSKISALATLLTQDRPAQASEIVRHSFPHIAGYFLNDGPKDPFRPLYLNLLLSLALDERFGGEDWSLAENLASAIIGTGTSHADYELLLSSLTSIWEERGDPRRMDWALDLLDLLIASPSPDPGALDAFYEAVSASIQKHARRLEPAQRSLFKLLCSDLSRAIPSFLAELEGPADDNVTDVLSGKLVAIYTLDESSGKRARDLMGMIYQDADIRVNHDHVGTDQLKHLARNADYFLMVTRSAKHAATTFIKAERPMDKRPVDYPSGKGSSSIISALRKALDEYPPKSALSTPVLAKFK